MTKSKTNIIRIASLLLMLSLSFALVACASSDASTDTDSVSDSVVADSNTDAATDNIDSDAGATTSDLADVEPRPENKEIENWNGATLKVLCSASERGEDVYFSDSGSTEYSRLVKERDAELEEKYGIKLEKTAVSDVCAHVNKTNQTNSSPGLVYASGNGGMSDLMLYGALEDLYAYSDRTVTSAGVSVSALRQLSVYGKLYMLTGAPIRSSVESTMVTAYNKSALAGLGYERGYLESLVKDGKWTYDTMVKLIKEFSGVGLSGSEDTLYSVWKGMGALTVEKKTGDVPSVSVYSSRNIYYFGLVHKLYDLVGDISDDSVSSLFYINTLINVKNSLSGDMAVLPMPSYHEDGEYACVLDFGSTFFTAMPSGAENKELALDYLRGLYSHSIETVYERTIEDYNFGDREVLDIILKSRYYDFFDMYGIGHIMKTAFSAKSETADFDKLLGQRARFAEQALDIALKQTVGENTNR